MKTCVACGMPLEKTEDFPNGDENLESCVYCTDDSGLIRSCEEIFQWGVIFFQGMFWWDQETAERMTRKNMNSLPYWQEHRHPCLDGEEASDEEFTKMMLKM